jgi:hypothetical protein
MLARRGDLQNLDPGALHEAEQTSAIASVDSMPMRWTSPNERIEASICRYP